MTSTAILFPIVGMLLLTVVVWIFMMGRRVVYLTAEQVDPNELKFPDAVAARVPDAIRSPADNFKNLFEIPVLFYVIALAVYMTDTVDASHYWCAWVFFGSRCAHSLVQCWWNNVNHRFAMYLVGVIAVIVMIVRFGLGLLSASA